MTDKEFQAVIVNALDEGLTVDELADEFDVSMPTVKRWADGLNSPHSIAMDYVVNRITKMLDGKI